MNSEMKRLQRTSYLTLLIFFLLSCEGDVGPSGIESLIETTDELAGSNCLVGGLKVNIGLDTNKNGVLDTDEIKSTKYICSGVAGQNSLVKTTVENPGTNCPAGGLKIEAGIDLNKNATLEQNEVQSTQFVCNGTNGINSLVNSSIVTPGIDCINGGIKLDVGVDTNRNGSLEQSEIQTTRFICNGADGLSVDQIRFQLISLVGLGSSSTTGDLAPAWMYLRKFNKKDFSLMKSAILSANISTENSTSASICTVDLFNLTDNVAILGSEVQTTSATRVWVDSGDFLSNIPDKEIDIAIRLRTNTSGGFANCIQAYFILSKN